MTAALRHVKGLPLLGLLPLLRHAAISSVAADPVLLALLSKIDDRASDVHIAIRIAGDLRLPLYARQAQTQCPRRWLLAYTPVARAVWPREKPFHRPDSRRLPNASPHLRRLTGCPR